MQSEQLCDFTIIKVKGYQYNITDDNIHIVSISEVDIYEENLDHAIGDPVSVLDRATAAVKHGDHYFVVDDDDWDDDSQHEEPLTWSLEEPSNFCDWTIEVTRIQLPSTPTSAGVSKVSGKEKQSNNKHSREHKGKEANRADSKPIVQYYHVHKAILSVG